MQVLSITTMFPNPRMPVHAQFVKQRLDALSRHVNLTVVSPIPWFPFEKLIPRYRNRSAVPYTLIDNPYPVFYPKFLSVPVILKPLDGFFLALSVLLFLRKHALTQRFHLLDCHLAFPEGFAGSLLSRFCKIPYVVTLRGHDINDLHRFPVRKRQVVYALRHCQRYFGVAQALVDGAVKMGAPAEKGFRSANGVNSQRFRPDDRREARRKLGLSITGRYFLSVSHLVPRKGLPLLIEALAHLRPSYPDLRYIIVGKGGEEGDSEPGLRRLAESLGVADALVWAGAVLNENLHTYYSAADLFCLASEKEGWPNVVLEALACGTPVVAAATWGVPEILTSPDLGLLVKDRTPEAYSTAIGRALENRWDRESIREYAASRSWEKVADDLAVQFREVLATSKNASGKRVP